MLFVFEAFTIKVQAKNDLILCEFKRSHLQGFQVDQWAV